MLKSVYAIARLLHDHASLHELKVQQVLQRVLWSHRIKYCKETNEGICKINCFASEKLVHISVRICVNVCFKLVFLLPLY